MKKEKDRKGTENVPNSTNRDPGYNSRSRSSSSSGSADPLSDKHLEGQPNTRDGGRVLIRSSLQETSITPSSTGMFGSGVVSDPPSTTADVEKKADIKSEPMEYDENTALLSLKSTGKIILFGLFIIC